MNAEQIAKKIMELDSFDTYHAWDCDISIYKIVETITENPADVIEWLEENEETELVNEIKALQEV